MTRLRLCGLEAFAAAEDNVLRPFVEGDFRFSAFSFLLHIAVIIILHGCIGGFARDDTCISRVSGWTGNDAHRAARGAFRARDMAMRR